MERIIQIMAQQTDIVDSKEFKNCKEIRGALWGLGDNGTLYCLGKDGKWKEVVRCD